MPSSKRKSHGHGRKAAMAAQAKTKPKPVDVVRDLNDTCRSLCVRVCVRACTLLCERMICPKGSLDASIECRSRARPKWNTFLIPIFY